MGNSYFSPQSEGDFHQRDVSWMSFTTRQQTARGCTADSPLFSHTCLSLHKPLAVLKVDQQWAATSRLLKVWNAFTLTSDAAHVYLLTSLQICRRLPPAISSNGCALFMLIIEMWQGHPQIGKQLVNNGVEQNWFDCQQFRPGLSGGKFRVLGETAESFKWKMHKRDAAV